MVKEIEICIVVILKVFSVALLFNLTCLQNVCVKYTLPLGMNVRRQSRLKIIVSKVIRLVCSVITIVINLLKWILKKCS